MNWTEFGKSATELLKDEGFRRFALWVFALVVVSGIGFHGLTLWLIGTAQRESTAETVRAIYDLKGEFKSFREVFLQRELARRDK